VRRAGPSDTSSETTSASSVSTAAIQSEAREQVAALRRTLQK